LTAPLSPSLQPKDIRPAAVLRSRGWVLKRALFGLFLITVFAAGGSALMYASIEPETSAAAGE
jgi:hypothetical protein